MARLGDLFIHIRNGANIKQGLGDSGYPITRIETISNRIVDRNKMGYAGIKDLSKYQDFVLQDGDILMSHINSETHLGKTALYEKADDEIIIHGMNLLLLRPNKNLITSKYAFYYFSSQAFLKQIPNITKKSVNQASFTVSALKELSFPEVSLIEQKIAIDNLDKVSMLIEHRKQQLSKLDELVKSRFVEMFGDPFDTTKWAVKKLKDISESMIDGSNVNPDFYKLQGDVLFLRIQNVWRNEFRLDDSVYITQEINHKYYYDTSLKTGDLLITKIGRYYTKDSSLGRVSVYRGEDDCANYSNNIMRVRLNDSVNSEFVNVLLNLDDYQSYIKRTSKGGTDKRALSKSLIGSYPIIIPPKTLQEKFVSFVKQVDKSKLSIQQSLEKLETLKKSLMQQYFG